VQAQALQSIMQQARRGEYDDDLNSAGQAAAAAASSSSAMPPQPLLFPLVLKWFSGSNHELLSLGVVQAARDSLLKSLSLLALSLLPSRLSQVMWRLLLTFVV
jgi:hypothetical protein